MLYKKFFTTLLLTLSLAVGMTAVAQDAAPAFPGAEGFARYAVTGGRGQTVYHVTNLKDSGAGSFRDAVKGSNRFIVFDVSGYIDLQSELRVSGSNITIAGQTAPGGGITLRYYTVVFTGNNIICRFIRFRRSQVKDVNDGADASWGRNQQNIILDHCSFSWSIDEIASFYDNKNFTMQWCTLGEALRNPGHSKGEHSYGGIWGGKNASFHHNFLLHMQNRMPRFNGARYGWTGGNTTEYKNPTQAERVDFRNCVMYNWGTGSACYGGPGGGYINMVNNYYKAGPATKNKSCVTQVTVSTSGNSDTSHPEYYGLASRYYINGNYVTAQNKVYDWSGVSYDSGLETKNGVRYIPDAKHMYGDGVTYETINGKECVCLKLDQPISAGEVTTHSAANAYTVVLKYAGASLVRDAIDERYAEEAKTGTTTYSGTVTTSGDGKSVTPLPGIIDLINNPASSPDPKKVSFPELESVSRPAGFDTDQDGMPDAWETANGLNPNDASDGKTKTLDSRGFYTNLEVYANSLVERIVKLQNANASSPIQEYYPSATSDIVSISSDAKQSRFYYYDLSGRLLSEPSEGVCIRRQVLPDGSVIVDKVISVQ